MYDFELGLDLSQFERRARFKAFSLGLVKKAIFWGVGHRRVISLQTP
jgi:hypothetical protein